MNILDREVVERLQSRDRQDEATDEGGGMPLDLLLVEDNLAHSTLIHRAFEGQRLKVEVRHASSLVQARSMRAEREPDVAIVDWLLPDGEGIEFLSEIEVEGRGFPAVIMTSQGNEQVAVQAMKAGALDYVVKTEVTLAEMPRTIERVMREWNLIEQRRRMEKALLESEARLNSIVKSIPDIIYRLDRRGEITFISDAIRRYGYEPEELIGTRILDLLHPLDRDRAHRRIDERRTGERSTRSLEVRLLEKRQRDAAAKGDGSGGVDHPVLLVNAEGIYSTPQPAAESQVGTQGVARDITERKRLEEQLLQSQKIEAIGQLAGGIAHDFNNMLMAILSTCDFLILTTEEEDPKRQDIELIKEAGERAANLTQQILAFSRRQIRHPEVMDLNEVIDEMHKMLRRLIGEDIELVRVSGAELGKVKADRTQIEQIVMNLALNARDAMPEGGELTIETGNMEVGEGFARQHPPLTPGAYVRLVVRDTGTGIDADTRDRIFEPFFTTKEVGQGTGMGLSTVFGIVKQSGGAIWVDSEMDRGTEFAIFLPRIEPPEEGGDAEVDFEALARGTETILLVEDDSLVRRQVQRMLARLGYRVLEARDGEEALARYEREERIDLLLTDVIMPHMSGKQLADRLLDDYPTLRVIYMSGYTDEALLDQGVLQSGKVFLTKPFDNELLADTIRRVLDS